MGETIHEGWLVKSPPDKKSQSLPRFFQAVSRPDFSHASSVNYIITVLYTYRHAYVLITYNNPLSMKFVSNFAMFLRGHAIIRAWCVLDKVAI